MKALVIYDSVYGNTGKIAKAIGKELGCDVLSVGAASSTSLKGVELLLIGSPTHGGMPSPAMQKFIGSIPADSLRGVRVAAFDTWITPEGQGFLARAAIGIFGHAAPRTLSRLKALGATPAAEPIGFLVNGKEGPLIEGELERAKDWAKTIAKC